MGPRHGPCRAPEILPDASVAHKFPSNYTCSSKALSFVASAYSPVIFTYSIGEYARVQRQKVRDMFDVYKSNIRYVWLTQRRAPVDSYSVDCRWCCLIHELCKIRRHQRHMLRSWRTARPSIQIADRYSQVSIPSFFSMTLQLGNTIASHCTACCKLHIHNGSS